MFSRLSGAARILTTACLLGPSALLLSSSVAQAQDSYVTASDASTHDGNFFIGFEFNVSQPTTVTQLGFIDSTDSGTPLSASTGVGLYSVPIIPGSGDPKPATYVASAIIPGGTAVTAGGFGARGVYWAPIAPVDLTPGDYVILGDTGGPGNTSSFLSVPSDLFSFRSGSGLSYVDGWFGGSDFPGEGNSFNVTNQSNVTTSWAAAVFGTDTTVAATPEPGAVALIVGTATAGLGLYRRRRRTR